MGKTWISIKKTNLFLVSLKKSFNCFYSALLVIFSSFSCKYVSYSFEVLFHRSSNIWFASPVLVENLISNMIDGWIKDMTVITFLFKMEICFNCLVLR